MGNSNSKTRTGRVVDRFAGPLAVAGTALVALVAARYGTQGDLSHMWKPTQAFADLRWDEIYPSGTPATSMTGWIVLVLVPYVATRSWLGDVEGFVFAGLLALPLVLFSMRWTVRVLWPTCSVALAWGIAFVSLVLPTTWAVWFNYYHPQDLAAVGVIVFGMGLAVRQRWGWAGVVFGIAVMTRQWAILAALPVAGLAGKQIWKFAVGGAAACVILLAPVMLSGGNEDWLVAISAGDTRSAGNTLFGKFRLDMEINAAQETSLNQLARGAQDIKGSNSNWFSHTTRVLPVLFAAGLGVVMFLRRLRDTSAAVSSSLGLSNSALIVSLAVSGLAFRMIFEGSDYPYYWVPFGILLLLMVPYVRGSWVAAIAVGTFPWVVEWLLPERFVDVQAYTRMVLVMMYSLIVVALPWLLLRMGREANISPEDKHHVDSVTGNARGVKSSREWIAWLSSGVVCIFVVCMLLTSTVPFGAAREYGERKQFNSSVKQQIEKELNR